MCAYSAHPATCYSLFFFHHPAPTALYTLSLHDALPICAGAAPGNQALLGAPHHAPGVQQHSQPEPTPNTDGQVRVGEDRKSTRLNSSHITISYAVFCLKKKKKNKSNSYNHKNITHTITH